MTEEETTEEVGRKKPSAWKTLLLCIAILAAGGTIVFIIYSTEPTAQREGTTRKSAMLVETMETQAGTYRPRIQVLGTVVPSRDVMLTPQVQGELLERSSRLVPGSLFSKGESLLRIDPADYEIALLEAQSAHSQAKAELQLEKGRQSIAEQDFQMLDGDIQDVDQELVLRKPQLAIAKARLDAAEAAVRRAELDLERTEVTAPFDALVIDRLADVGTRVSPGTPLAHLAATDSWWIEAHVPLSAVYRLDIPDVPGEGGATAVLSSPGTWPPGAVRSGELYALSSQLENSTRLAKVLIEVKDPLGIQADSKDLPRLVLGEFLQAEIKLEALENVVRISRDHLRKDNTVWVMQNGRLEIRDAEIVFKNAQYAFVSKGLNDGEQLVTSQISRVVNGAELRTEASNEGAGAE